MSSGAHWGSASLQQAAMAAAAKFWSTVPWRVKAVPLTEEKRLELAPKLEGVVWRSYYTGAGFALELVWHGFLWETSVAYGEVPFPPKAYTELLALATRFRHYGKSVWRCSLCEEPWAELATCRDCSELICKECSVDWDSDERGLKATCVACNVEAQEQDER